MSNRKDFIDRKRSKKYIPHKKTEFERQRTREEVRQIKKDLINYARTSWGKKWIKSNLQFGRPFRMQRGIEYANDERRIDNITINPGEVFATVQGTAPTPYRVKINFEIIKQEDSDKIIARLAQVPLNLIEMLEGKLPEEIIKIFEGYGYSLFPEGSKGLDARCSCPDKAIPCKHIASVVLYISRILDFDPFILLKLKGTSKNELLRRFSIDLSINTKPSNNYYEDIKSKAINFNVPTISMQILRKKRITEKTLINFNIKKKRSLINNFEILGIPSNSDNKTFEIVLRGIINEVSLKSFQLSFTKDFHLKRDI